MAMRRKGVEKGKLQYMRKLLTYSLTSHRPLPRRKGVVICATLFWLHCAVPA